MSQLQALPAYKGYAGIKSSTGVITPPAKYKGVASGDLADLVGGITKANGVTIVAKDGYGMTFSYRQIMEDGVHHLRSGDGRGGAAGRQAHRHRRLRARGQAARRGRRSAQAGRRRTTTPGPGRGRALVGQVGRRRSR